MKRVDPHTHEVGLARSFEVEQMLHIQCPQNLASFAVAHETRKTRILNDADIVDAVVGFIAYSNVCYP